MPRALVLGSAVIAAVFMLVMAAKLPESVASHFGRSGAADSYMSRPLFLVLMLAIGSLLPAVVWEVQARMAGRGKVNIPHADYWFEQERRASTVRFLQVHAAALSIALVALMSFVYWLLVQVNNPGSVTRLDLTLFFAGMGLFFVFTLVWVSVLYVRFRKDA